MLDNQRAKKLGWFFWILVRLLIRFGIKVSYIYKLERLGVRDPLLKWFKTYLTGRKQRVIIDGQSSDWREITAGVPQALC